MALSTSTRERCVLLDFDGTIVDTMPALYELVRRELQARGIEPTTNLEEEVATKLLDKAAKDGQQSGARLVFSLLWQIARYSGLSRIKALDFTLACLRQVRQVYQNSKIFPDVPQNLQRLSSNGFRLGLVTMASRKEVEALLSANGILTNFDVIITREDVKRGKPDPEGCLKACELLGIPPKNGVYVGDLPTDILAGKKAGMKAVGVLTGIAPKKWIESENPDYIAENLSDAVDWILNHGMTDVS